MSRLRNKRAALPFSRPGRRFKPGPTVLVICEDSKSSKNYLQDVSIHFRAHVKVLVSHIGKTDPKGIVNEAARKVNSYDRVFCVIDRDEHKSFDEAMQTAAVTNVHAIASYPCFEYWLLLHFVYSRKPYRRQAIDRLQSA
jgi:hypothetical protein